jgi:hypothetical protein
MRLKHLSLPIGLLILVACNSCALFVVVGGAGMIGSKIKNPGPNLDIYAPVDTIWTDETTEDEAVEAEAEDADTVSIENIDGLPKSDMEKVDRSIFPADVLGNDASSNTTNTVLKLFETEFDMGTIEYGDSVKHTFQYQNVGSQEFVLEQYTVGCGCTQVSAPKKRLAPGEMDEITLQFNSKEKDGPGDYTSDAMLIGNVPDGFVEFKIKIKVVAKKKY